ncbi:Peroxiredoxin-5, mitochondrial [Amphibalanus amphitrite]|uniref:Peroxiredoxin-5 n=3 Tax=Amphibalanus amphitrite TaxID=1232801 RepID=A0A6A4WB78_AMPAM|nr:Peroxiredoxin-5, mitochondrial [Amphibalanus amphitrite]
MMCELVFVNAEVPPRNHDALSVTMRAPCLRWSQWAGRRLALSLTPSPASACVGRAPSRSLATSTPLAMIKVGDKLPEATLFEDSPANSVKTSDLCKGKRVILIGVPGAFTPACSQTHLPGYIKEADTLKATGVDEIVCMAVNDPFVTAGWAKAQGAEGKVRILSDVKRELTSAMGMDFDLSDILGTVRCKRFSMVLQDGVVESLDVEPDGKGLSCSLADVLAKKLAKK